MNNKIYERRFAVIFIAIIVFITNSITFYVVKVKQKHLKNEFKDKILEKLDVKYNLDIGSEQEIIELFKKRTNYLLSLKNNTENLKKEIENLSKKLKAKEDFLRQIQEEIAMESKNIQTSSVNSVNKKENLSYESIAAEFKIAIEKENMEEAMELLNQLFSLGPQYFPQVVEYFSKIEAIYEKYAEFLNKESATEEEKEKAKKINEQFWGGIDKLMNNVELFDEFQEWVLNTKQYGGKLIDSTITHLLVEGNHLKAEKLHDYLKEKIIKNGNIEAGGRNFIHITEMPGEQARMLQHLKDTTTPIVLKKAIAYAFGILIAKSNIEEELEKELKNLIKSDNELGNWFEQGKKYGEKNNWIATEYSLIHWENKNSPDENDKGNKK
ncbi:MAG: hypothetical protein QXU40_03980 [Candidatus Pacearchaeota archaeon]